MNIGTRSPFWPLAMGEQGADSHLAGASPPTTPSQGVSKCSARSRRAWPVRRAVSPSSSCWWSSSSSASSSRSRCRPTSASAATHRTPPPSPTSAPPSRPQRPSTRTSTAATAATPASPTPSSRSRPPASPPRSWSRSSAPALPTASPTTRPSATAPTTSAATAPRSPRAPRPPQSRPSPRSTAPPPPAAPTPATPSPNHPPTRTTPEGAGNGALSRFPLTRTRPCRGRRPSIEGHRHRLARRLPQLMLRALGRRLAREESGMTLIELLVVSAILGILTSIATPSYLGFRDNANKTAASANVYAIVPDIEWYAFDNYAGSPPSRDPDYNGSDASYTGTNADTGYADTWAGHDV